MKFKLLYWLKVLLTVACFNAWQGMAVAVELDNIYQGKVNVVDKSPKARIVGIKNAFKAVIVKVAGKQTVLNQPLIKQAINQYRDYLVQYGYLVENNQTMIEASFDKDRIRNLFSDAQLPVWGRHRPLVLVWLIDEQALERQVVSDLTESSLPLVIKTTASAVGLPVTLPLMDITDAMSVQVSDIWGKFSQPIEEASKRYGAEAYVIIRLSNSSLTPEVDSENCQPLCSGPSYAIDWQLNYDGLYESELKVGADKNSLLRVALNEISFEIANRYSVTLDKQTLQETEISIANLTNLNRFNQANTLIGSLSIVNDLQLLKVEGSTYTFKVELLGETQAFLKSLSLDSRLSRFEQDTFADEENDNPDFHWN